MKKQMKVIIGMLAGLAFIQWMQTGKRPLDTVSIRLRALTDPALFDEYRKWSQQTFAKDNGTIAQYITNMRAVIAEAQRRYGIEGAKRRGFITY